MNAQMVSTTVMSLPLVRIPSAISRVCVFMGKYQMEKHALVRELSYM